MIIAAAKLPNRHGPAFLENNANIIHSINLLLPYES